MNLSKLHSFKWTSGSLGNVLVHNFSGTANSILNKAFESYLEANSQEFVRILITAVCQLDSQNTGEYSADRITYEQSKQLSDEELNDFAEKFLEKNIYLKNDQSKSSRKETKTENGEERTTIEYEKRKDANKSDGESYCDFLKRLMHHNFEKTRKLLDSLVPKNNIFSNSVRDLINQNRELSDSLGSSINRFESISPVQLPIISENPAYETKLQLRALGEEFSKTSSLIKNINDLGLQMAFEMASSSKTTKLHNTIMISIGLATLVFSAVMSYMTYVSSNESSRITQELLISSSAKSMAIAEEQQQLSKEIYNQLKNIASRITIMDPTQGSLDKNVDLLNLETSRLTEELKKNHITKGSTGLPNAAFLVPRDAALGSQ
ncbi:hypothetical protein [Nitrosomonas mobilis]|uniref:Uncharacterized protein n=1 Tax=Nitrosomonas mobilis TaxID=51642 RepID=A0A1G5SGH4_9PROT|nr:hypothetical protein [Nitrosomonas mobilis]SCZ86284.1 hypothetical protein NSMM_510002 [Nitrosomonas mobilis]